MLNDLQIEVTEELQERYIELMCGVEPASVLPYLKYTRYDTRYTITEIQKYFKANARSWFVVNEIHGR